MKPETFALGLSGRWPVLWMLVVVRVAMGYQFQAAAGAEPWLIADFGIDYATVGSLIGFYTLPGIVAALPGGYIARRIGEKNLLIFGMALMPRAAPSPASRRRSGGCSRAAWCRPSAWSSSSS